MICPNCGNKVENDMNNCPNCGTSLSNNNYSSITKRDIVSCVILSIITCGIYAYYWIYMMTEESNALVSPSSKTADGCVTIVYMIITCGIYTYYWNFKMGKKLYEVCQSRNIATNDNSATYLILSIFGLSIVNWCLIQSDLNKLAG